MKKILKNTISILLTFAIIITAGVIGYGHLQKYILTEDVSHYENQIEKIELIEIGELRTAKLTATGIAQYGDCNKSWFTKKELKFTKNNIKLHYSINLEAGYNLSEINKNQTIKDDYVLIKLPEVKIYEPSFNMNDTFFFDEHNGWFNKITEEDYTNVQQNAVKDALSLKQDELISMAEESAKNEITELYAGAGVKVVFK